MRVPLPPRIHDPHRGTSARSHCAGEIEDEPAVLLKGLPGEHLGEDVGAVLVGGHVAHADLAGAAQLAHLVQLAVDVPGVLRRRIAVAQVVGALVVGASAGGFGELEPDRLREADDVEYLDG